MTDNNEEVVPENSEYVTITQEEYNRLLKDTELLGALQSAGVDNWDGYDYAIELLNQE